MKYRYIKVLLLAIIPSLYLTGCTDFLEKDVLGGSTSENYYDTPYKLQESLNGVYDILQSDMFNNSEWIFGEACGDDVIGSDEGGNNQIAELVNFRFSTSNEWIAKRYEVNYRGINRANQVIANAYRVKFSSEQYSNYKNTREIVGQAKLLRALFYFNLVKTYGGVPIRPETEDIQTLVIPRSTKEEVYAYIEKDLREAAIMLPLKYTEVNQGKAGLGLAVGLLMKVLMYQATPGVPSEKWEEIVKLGEYFIEGKTITFGEMLRFNERYSSDFETFRQSLWFKPASISGSGEPVESESTPLPVLANQYGLERVSVNGEPLDYWEIFQVKGEFYKGSVFEVVFRESADGTNGDDNEGSVVFNDLYGGALRTSDPLQDVLNNDPRVTDIVGIHGTASPDGERIEVYYSCLKWYTAKKDRPLKNNDNAKNRRYMRFAEIVLTYAEALNEAGFGERALNQLNKVKAEANKLTGIQILYNGGGYGYMRSQIWKERRIELCHEWDRFFDIVRRGEALLILKNLAKETNHSRGILFKEGINEIFPIPQNEIDLSNGVVLQNPGY